VPRYVVLLRGVNVGGNKKIAMADLRDLLVRLGYTDVRTHLNSGNAVFTSGATEPAALAGEIERGIRDTLSMSVRCVVRSGEELRAVVEGNPLRDIATDGSRLAVLFLAEAPDPELLAAHDPRQLAPETIRLGDRVIYHWCPDDYLAAPDVSAFVLKHWKATVTARNWNTVAKLAELAEG
jgi:uncharacterized protein (DUF1697 family)